MSKRESATKFDQEFINRTRWAREVRFNTQDEICKVLGIEQGTYKQYETRTPLPHYLIERFCLTCGVDIPWLIAKNGRGPAKEPKPRPPRRRRVAAKRKVA